MGVRVRVLRGATTAVATAALSVAFAVAFGWLAPCAAAQGVLDVPEAHLKFTMPPIEKASLAQSGDPACVRRLHGLFHGKRITVEVHVLPIRKYGFSEPAEVIDQREKDFAEQAHETLAFSERTELTGSFGALTYAELAVGSLAGGDKSDPPETVAMLTWMVDEAACAIEISLAPVGTADDVKELHDALTKGVVVEGKPRDPRWSDAEATARWERDVPEKARKNPLKPPLRTAHYIVLTNSAGGALFGKKMEENYEKIRATFPFPERKGRRLMPIFLFRSKDEYLDFCTQMHAGGPGSKGHAYKDYYATWYESPNDPVHIHEATHQIFKNRLGLNGGGSWFQEGLAEYMCTRREERNVMAQSVAKGKARHLKQFLAIERLLSGSQTEAQDNYIEASLLIEFLRESKETKGKFMDFVEKVGSAPRGSMSEIEKAIHASLGWSIDEFDAAFTKYCVKR
jgi:hypothetical protein